MLAYFLHRTAARVAGLALISCAWATPAAVRADILILKNGDRLTGKVERRADGKIFFHSDVFGDIAAPEGAVALVEKPAASVPVEALAGLPPQGWASSPALSTEAAPAPSPPAAAPTPPVAPNEFEHLGLISADIRTPPVTPWSGKVEFGYDNIVSSDVRTVATTLRAEAERTVGDDNFLVKDRFLYGSSGGTATTDEEDGDFRWRHNLSELLFTQTDQRTGKAASRRSTRIRKSTWPSRRPTRQCQMLCF